MIICFLRCTLILLYLTSCSHSDMTLTETDRLRAEQTSAAVSHSALPLNFFFLLFIFWMVSKSLQNTNTHQHQQEDSVKYMDMDSMWLFYIPSQMICRNISLWVSAPEGLGFETTRDDLHPSYHKKALAWKCSLHSKVTREIQFIITQFPSIKLNHAYSNKSIFSPLPMSLRFHICQQNYFKNLSCEFFFLTHLEWVLHFPGELNQNIEAFPPPSSIFAIF